MTNAITMNIHTVDSLLIQNHYLSKPCAGRPWRRRPDPEAASPRPTLYRDRQGPASEKHMSGCRVRVCTETASVCFETVCGLTDRVWGAARRCFLVGFIFYDGEMGVLKQGPACPLLTEGPPPVSGSTTEQVLLQSYRVVAGWPGSLWIIPPLCVKCVKR